MRGELETQEHAMVSHHTRREFVESLKLKVGGSRFKKNDI
jgi:hypothetical protein